MIKYYVNFNSLEAPVVIKLKDLTNGKGHSSLGLWEILEYIIGTPSDAGLDASLKIGDNISGNELNGVGVYGFDKYKAENKHDIFRKLFTSL